MSRQTPHKMALPLPLSAPRPFVAAGGAAPHSARRGGGGPRPSPGGSEGQWAPGRQRLLPPAPPAVYSARAAALRPSGCLRAAPFLAQIPVLRAVPRMPGRGGLRLALLALCLGAAAAGGGDGQRRGGKNRRQAQTASVPQATPAQGKREYRHGLGSWSGGWPPPCPRRGWGSAVLLGLVVLCPRPR